MRKFKKNLAIVLAMACMLSMCGCGAKKDRGNTEFSEATVTETAEGTTEDNNIVDVEKKNYMAKNLLDEVQAGTVKTVELDERFVTSATDFSINIFKEAGLQDLKAGKNVMVSPESIMTCLGMTANGAKDDTLSGMENTVCPGLNINNFNEYLFTNLENRRNTEGVVFNEANSIWIRKDEEAIKVNEDYLKTVKTYYDAGVFYEDFNNETVDSINYWIKDNTNNMIDKVLEGKIDDSVVMYLINAIAFEAEWDEQYEDFQIDEDGSFTNSKGEKEKATMLNSTEGNYMENDEAEAFLKYYKDYNFAFMGILPKDNISADEFVNGLTGEKFRNLYADRYNHRNVDVYASIPEFTFDYDTSLKESLSTLGMSKAFEENADFSNMANTNTGLLYIGDVIHKTHIELDRNGTKAAAVTVVIMDCEATAMPEERTIKEIKLDRPFVYAIVDVNTGIPVFIGAVNTLE